MEHKEIRELAALMKEMGLTSLEYTEGGAAVKLERAASPAAPAASAAASVKPSSGDQETGAEPAAIISTAGDFMVKSPMVGVFYASPSVEKPPYVAVGDKVHAGDVLCIIEAMKIMNEITAERDGVITEICVESKSLVEFGQPLFRIGADKA